MKTKAIILVLFVIGVNLKVVSQTQLIAHKSHSGKNSTFNPNALVGGNFGNFRYTIVDSVIKLSDHSIIEVRAYFDTGTLMKVKRDTVKGDYSTMSIDYLKKLYPAPTVLKGFENNQNLKNK